ncbi:MAG: site-2 protease family protein [Chloroflexi bacterium]|nr:site-2 protease family protein [Chloroflexota bacterium]
MGLLVFILILAVVIVTHELGHFYTARRVGVRVLEFGLGYPPRLWSIIRGETRYSLNLLPLGGFVKLEGEEDPSDPASLAAKRMPARLLVLASGALMNALLPVLLFTLAVLIPQKVLVGGEGLQVSSVAAGSPAQVAGLQTGDTILAVDGRAVSAPEELQKAVEARLGQELALLLERPSVGQVEARLIPRAQPPPGEGPLGISLDYARPIYETRSYPPWEAVPNGIAATGRLVSAMFAGVGDMIGGREPATVVGVIGMAQATTEVARGGIHDILVWASIISLSLAIINLLPIPALDGGRIALLGLEAVRRKRLSPRSERLIHLIGFAVLLSFMFVVSYLDIARLARGGNILP